MSYERCLVILHKITPQPQSVPLVYAPYQHNPHKHWAQSRPISGQKGIPIAPRIVPPKMSIYEHGFRMTKAKPVEGEQPEHLKNAQRGTIEGFSNKSASRLREFMMTHHVEGGFPLAVTLTTQEHRTPEQWESILKRFRTTLESNQDRPSPPLALVFLTWRSSMDDR